MGNGGFTIAYPPLHELASSKNNICGHSSTPDVSESGAGTGRRLLKPFMRRTGGVLSG